MLRPFLSHSIPIRIITNSLFLVLLVYFLFGCKGSQFAGVDIDEVVGNLFVKPQDTLSNSTIQLCTRVSRSDLSSLAQKVIDNIESTPGALANSPVKANQILTTCNRFNGVEVDGPHIYSSVKDMIALAEHEVDIIFYQWEDVSNAVSEIGDGLIEAQARIAGNNRLLVRIIVDDVDGFLPFSPDRPVDRLWGARRRWISRGLNTSKFIFQFGTSPRATALAANLHDKFIVVDAKHLFVTGANPEVVHDPPDPWHDSGYFLEGDIGKSALSAFDQVWNSGQHWTCKIREKDCDKRDDFPSPNRNWMPQEPYKPGDIPVLAVGRIKKSTLLQNNDTNNPQDIAWLTVMDEAQEHIHVESPNINDDAFRNAVVRAVNRGVTVRLITSLGFNFSGTNMPTQGGNNQEVVGSLRNRVRNTAPERLQIRWYSNNKREPIEGNVPGASHAKYMSVDDQVSIVGSGNMETPAWNFSHEFNVLIDDHGVTKNDLEKKFFQPDWKNSISSYIELYEDNNGRQEIVCPIAVVNSNKVVRFHDSRFCDNDEARSVLLHDVPAGRVFRIYDDADRKYQDDDWTEIIVKKDLSRTYVNSFEHSYENEDIRVIAHKDDNLDGKVSAIEVSSRPIGPVLDFYEGNNGTQDLVCSNRLIGNSTKNFTRDRYCNNDEARSAIFHDIQAGRVFRLYDNSELKYQDDDWTEIIIKKDVKTLYIDSFERSFENSEVRVIAHKDDNLDGKVSALEITNQPIGTVLDLYEGNRGTQDLVCSIRVSGSLTKNFTKDKYCNNDEARSLKLWDFPRDMVIYLYDNSKGNREDDWGVLIPKRNIKNASLNSFESNTSNSNFEYLYFRNDNLDGKVSRIRVARRSELVPVVSLYEGNRATQNKVCDITVADKRVRFSKSKSCDNDEARSLQLTFAKAGTTVTVYDNGDCRTNDDWTRIRLKRDVNRLTVNSFERSYSNADVDVSYQRGGNLDGKVSCIRINAP